MKEIKRLPGTKTKVILTRDVKAFGDMLSLQDERDIYLWLESEDENVVLESGVWVNTVKECPDEHHAFYEHEWIKMYGIETLPEKGSKENVEIEL